LVMMHALAARRFAERAEPPLKLVRRGVSEKGAGRSRDGRASDRGDAEERMEGERGVVRGRVDGRGGNQASGWEREGLKRWRTRGCKCGMRRKRRGRASDAERVEGQGTTVSS
jgi:hypothetical protein